MSILLNSKNIIDFVLSKTQRKTPTTIHRHLSIQRIRRFYIKKLKFVCQKFNDCVSDILKYFPFVNQANFFFKDFFNLLFNKNYYKIALARLNLFRILISKISKIYIKLLKSGSSLYVCKFLKKKAIGKICNLAKKLKYALEYLEKIKIQIKYIPLVSFYQKTILLCGSSCCGKSSLMSKLSKTKPNSCLAKFIQIGHFNNNFARWQIIDTPGLSSICIKKYKFFEIQTIGTLIHLDGILFYLFDFSNQNKTSILRQIDILNSILFLLNKKNKFFLLSKTDLNWEKTKNKIKKSLIFYIFRIIFQKKKPLKVSTHDEIGFVSVQYKLHIINNCFETSIVGGNVFFYQDLKKFDKKSLNKQSSLISIDLKKKNQNFSTKYLLQFNRRYNIITNKLIEKKEKFKDFLEEIGFVLQENLYYCSETIYSKINLKIKKKITFISASDEMGNFPELKTG